jgi:transposase
VGIEELNALLSNAIQPYEKRIDILEEQIRHLCSQLFGRKNERYVTSDQKQLDLFDEAEEAAEKALRKQSTVLVPAHERKKPGGKPLPAELPRIQVIHDLALEDKLCCGKEMVRIGADTCEKLRIKPTEILVEEHIRYKYTCKICEGLERKVGAVKIAPLPPQIIPQGIATPSLMAYIITNKFVDALPFYRQKKIFARLKIEFGRGTMAHNIIQVAGRCNPLMELMEKEIRSGPLIQIDETTVQVMKEPGRPNTSKSYMWVFRGGSWDHPILIYQYHPTRSGDAAKEFIKDYKGYVQTDGYAGYDFLDKMEGITHCGCLTHVRRNFADVIKAKIKPFVVGRKNWLFSGHPRGAKASATLYGLVETAKANGLEPYQYLNFLFERLPYAQTEEDYQKFLPMQVKLDPIKKSEISSD